MPVDFMPLNPNALQYLKNQISRGQMILFTGAGFSRGAFNHQGSPLPSTGELAKLLFTLLYPGEDFDDGVQLGELYAVAANRDPRGVERLLANHLSIEPGSLPEYYRAYFSFPWRRVYTLNIDELENAAAQHFDLPRQPLPLSALRASLEDANGQHRSNDLEVVHLNGRVTDSLDAMTFSEGQYGERLANQEPWYIRCATDIRTRPVLFVGTTLQESLLWQHLALRRRERPQGAYVPPPGSILISPQLSRVRAEMLKDMNVSWFEGTAESFNGQVLSQCAQEARRGVEVLASYRDTRGQRGVQLVSDLASEHPRLSTEYLLGDEPVWADLLQGRAVIRSSFDELLRRTRDILDGRAPNTVLAITGTAGNGKSTALMWLALELSNRGVPVIWVNKDSTPTPREIQRRVSNIDGQVVLAIDDADMYSDFVVALLADLARRPGLVCTLAIRSGKLGNIAIPLGRDKEISVSEFVVPGLTDEDIDELIGVLDRHHRLGKLKGASRAERRRAFSERAGRQLLVAMIEATLDVRFDEKAITEADELTGINWFIYALLVVATSQRYYLTKQETVMACQGLDGDPLAALSHLVGHHLVTLARPHNQYRVRHRVISEVVLKHFQVERKLKDVYIGLTYAVGAEIDQPPDRKARPSRMLARLISHKLLLNLIGYEDARAVFESVEDLLSFDYHYWLQRGSLEVESGDLRRAEQFLNQARSLSDDVRVQTEYGYMLLKKAVKNAADINAELWFAEGTRLLEGVISYRGHRDYYPFHILGSQGLAWTNRRARTREDRRRMLSIYVDVTDEGLKRHPMNRDLRQLNSDLRREVLETVVREDKADGSTEAG